MNDETISDDEFVGPEEQTAANDPTVGAGTPETAPHETPFDDDEALDVDAEPDIAGEDEDGIDDEDAGGESVDDV